MLTDAGIIGHSIVFTYTSTAELKQKIETLIKGDFLAPAENEQKDLIAGPTRLGQYRARRD